MIASTTTEPRSPAMPAPSSGTDSAGRVTLDHTLFASELIGVTADLPLVRIVFDPTGVLVVLAEDVTVRVELLPADPAEVARRCRRAWHQHLAAGGRLSGGEL
jgi:hypothetical protein